MKKECLSKFSEHLNLEYDIELRIIYFLQNLLNLK